MSTPVLCWTLYMYCKEQWMVGNVRRRPRKSWKDNIEEWINVVIVDGQQSHSSGVPQRRLGVTGIT